MSSCVGQTLHLPFIVPNRSHAYVDVSISTNNDPEQYGFDLLFPDNPLSDFVGFPICQATIHSPKSRGYASMYGWIQITRSTSDTDPEAVEKGSWEMDSIPITAGLNYPFCWFGPEPQLFDAPARANVQQIDWTARSFLTYIEDGLISKIVHPILVFEWGFNINAGEKSIKPLRELGLDVWNEHTEFFANQYSGWNFTISE